MSPIKFPDATGRILGEGTGHVELQYAAAEAKSTFFTGRIPALGVVRGFICPQCGLIKLYGTQSGGGS
jgi:hypothetical protein